MTWPVSDPSFHRVLTTGLYEQPMSELFTSSVDDFRMSRSRRVMRSKARLGCTLMGKERLETVSSAPWAIYGLQSSHEPQFRSRLPWWPLTHEYSWKLITGPLVTSWRNILSMSI